MIQYHLLLAREHGRATGVALMVGFSDDTSALTRKYEELTGAQVAEFAKQYSEVLFISNGAVLANHDFPDPSEVERQRKQKVLAEALRITAENEKAKAAHALAKEALASAAAAVKQLSPEQQKLLAEAAAAKAKADAEAKAQADAEEKLRQQEADDAAARAAETKAAADRAAARDTFIAELSALDYEALCANATANKVEFTHGEPSEVIIAALVKAAGFDS